VSGAKKLIHAATAGLAEEAWSERTSRRVEPQLQAEFRLQPEAQHSGRQSAAAQARPIACQFSIKPCQGGRHGGLDPMSAAEEIRFVAARRLPAAGRSRGRRRSSGLLERTADGQTIMAGEIRQFVECCLCLIEDVDGETVREWSRQGMSFRGGRACQQQCIDVVHDVIAEVRAIDQRVEMHAQSPRSICRGDRFRLQIADAEDMWHRASTMIENSRQRRCRQVYDLRGHEIPLRRCTQRALPRLARSEWDRRSC